jgi:hypothetical protein
MLNLFEVEDYRIWDSKVPKAHTLSGPSSLLQLPSRSRPDIVFLVNERQPGLTVLASVMPSALYWDCNGPTYASNVHLGDSPFPIEGRALSERAVRTACSGPGVDSAMPSTRMVSDDDNRLS